MTYTRSASLPTRQGRAISVSILLKRIVWTERSGLPSTDNSETALTEDFSHLENHDRAGARHPARLSQS